MHSTKTALTAGNESRACFWALTEIYQRYVLVWCMGLPEQPKQVLTSADTRGSSPRAERTWSWAQLESFGRLGGVLPADRLVRVPGSRRCLPSRELFQGFAKLPWRGRCQHEPCGFGFPGGFLTCVHRHLVPLGKAGEAAPGPGWL